MGSVNLDITRFEVTGVYTHPDARADIVLVHGLNGEPKKTWTAKNDVFWPASLLPESLQDHHANILVYGYNADVYSRGHDSASDNFIFQHAQTLISHLTAYRKRERTTRNPIIWVAHSLGGILVKRALLYSNDVHAANHEPFRAIFVSTYGIIFLGTPHNGSGLATWGRVLQAMSDVILPKKLFESESVLLKTLKHDNERLQEINSHFLDIYQRFQIHMVHEGHTTDLKGTKAFVVTADSASPQLPGVMYYGIEANHSGMCKFSGPNAPGYRTVSMAIYEWVEEAPSAIEVRWKMEDEEREARARFDIYSRGRPFAADLTHPDEPGYQSSQLSLLSPAKAQTIDPAITTATASESTPTSPPAPSPAQYEPPFLHPEPFRPNSYFVGRQQELQELHVKLTDKKKRAEGTSAVLIQCLPGGGKTHLARQYVFEHRADYPGGIYWVRAKSITEMEQFYWKIARNEALGHLLQKPVDNAPNAAGQRIDQDCYKSQNIVDTVRSWFNSFDQWLLIFDGIHFDAPGIRQFIPDAKNTSLIYTSIQHSATGMYEFDNPQIIELGLLDAEDAQNLLLEEMEKKKPWTQDARARALELVLLMGRLPLMIHVAARHLKATREPLSKYLRTYQARPRAGQLPAYRAVYSELDKRGAHAALNLMSILAFYDQLIPVGMITLGLGALNNVTPVRTEDARHKAKSINNSLKILIAFALIERTETDNVSPTSSQSSAKRSFDKSSGYVDVLRIHSVVQAFFIDLLKKELNFWLERAARVFCRSFSEAHRRITEDAKLGLPDDYRRFMIHGRKLLEHLTRAEKKSGVPAELTGVRADVEATLGVCQDAIDRLSEATQKQIVADSVLDKSSDDRVSQISVFERANSMSESDSASPSNQSSRTGSGLSAQTGTAVTNLNMDLDERRWIPSYGNDAMSIYQSPTLYHPPTTLDDQNPWHWHLPYPAEGSMIPGPPSREDSDDRTEVATPHVSEGPGGPAFRSGSGTNDWRPPISVHRTVRRNESRRYHDRAGSWRDSTISDPRISVSREIARGNVFRPESVASEMDLPGEDGQAGGSEAELRLARIRATEEAVGAGDATGREKAHGQHKHKSRAQSTGNLDTGSHSNITRDGHSQAEPTGLVSGFLSMPWRSQSSAWTAATLKRLRENILPSQAGKHSSEGDLLVLQSGQEAQEPLASSIASLLNRQPSPMFRGSRTAQSSPGHGNGPFHPPPPPSLQHDHLPASIRPWETPIFYTPGHSQLDVSDLSFGIAGDDVMAASYPPPYPPPRRGGRENAATAQHPPMPVSYWRQQSHLRPSMVTDGYTSQPMSRGGSSQSQPDGDGSYDSHGSQGAGIRIRMVGGSRSFTSAADGNTQFSHSLPSSYGPGLPSFSVAIPPMGLRTRPSWVETEPSPDTGDAFPEVNTSYQRWEEKHGQSYGQNHGRRHADAGGVPMSRSHSASPSGSAIRRRSRAAAVRQGGQGGQRSSSQGSAGSPVRSAMDSVYTSEPMARTGSGGIQLSDGRIVPFGQSPRRLPADVALDGIDVDNNNGLGTAVGLGIAHED